MILGGQESDMIVAVLEVAQALGRQRVGTGGKGDGPGSTLLLKFRQESKATSTDDKYHSEGKH